MGTRTPRATTAPQPIPIEPLVAAGGSADVATKTVVPQHSQKPELVQLVVEGGSAATVGQESPARARGPDLTPTAVNAKSSTSIPVVTTEDQASDNGSSMTRIASPPVSFD